MTTRRARAVVLCLLRATCALATHLAGPGVVSAHAQDAAASPLLQTFSERALQWGTTISEADCSQLTHAVWVRHAEGTECIRYYPSAGLEPADASALHPKLAVLFFHGDHLAGKMPLGNYGKITPQRLLDTVQRNEQQYKVPYILVARPGVYGSSGDHTQRRRAKEFLSLNAAVDAIKARYGLEQVVLAGQSGGSTAAAAILTLGRTDVKCMAAGSGNYAVKELAVIKWRKSGAAPRCGCDVTGYCAPYDVIEHVDGIAPDPARQIYLIGDPQDQNTVFPLQQAFFDKVRAAGHQVTLLEEQGRGPDRHSLSHVTFRVAGACARGLPVTAVAGKPTNVEAAPSTETPTDSAPE